jgi:hypothetical protein
MDRLVVDHPMAELQVHVVHKALQVLKALWDYKVLKVMQAKQVRKAPLVLRV